MLGSRSRPAWVVFWLLASALALAAPAVPKGSVQGTVTLVEGGDSLWLMPAAGSAVQVRLRDIDAPEPCQPWGAESRRALAELVLGKTVKLHLSGRDERGRALGVVWLDDVNVGTRQVEEGHAWSVRTRWDEGPLVKQERMARALTRGLHAAPGAQMPRHFRVTHGPCAAGEAAVNSPSALPPAAAVTPTLPAARPAPGNTYRCDGRTHCSQMTSCAEARYFLAHCPGVKMDGDRNGIPCEQQWCH
jgi:micrococcal nuclease